MEKLIFNAEVIRQFLSLMMNRHFEVNLKNVKIDLEYDKTKLLTIVVNGSVEYIPKKK